MALTTSPGAAVASPPPQRAVSAPFWILGLYLGGLVLVYIGERVLSGLEKGAGVVTVLGLSSVVASTALRFSPKFRSGGERKSIETLLLALSVTGLVGLLVYFATSAFGFEKLGFNQLETETRTRIEELGRFAWVSLIAVAVLPMIFAETALRPMRNAERPESRRVRSAAAAGLSLALVAVYGSLFVYAASAIDLKVDYSYFKTSQPSESTRKLVQNLSGDPIRVVAFFPEVNEVRSQVQSYLRDLGTGSPKLKVEMIDRLLAPKLAKDLRANQDGIIVFKRGDVIQSLNVGADMQQARGKLKTLDRDFQEVLLKIANSRRTAYMTVGHGELNDITPGSVVDKESGRSTRILRQLLTKQNFQLKDLGLAQGLSNDVPEDADVLLILGPTGAFNQQELASLRRYVDRGGRVVLALDPDALAAAGQLTSEGVVQAEPAAKPASSAAPAAAAPDLEAKFQAALADAVGIKWQPAVLANEKQHVRVRFNDSDRTRLVANSFSSHASVSTLSRNAPRAAVVVFGAGSLSASAPNTQTDFTVRTPPSTFNDLNRNYSHESNEELQVYNLAAAITRSVGPNPPKPDPKPDPKDKAAKDKEKAAKKNEALEFRAFVLADADALSDFVMGEVVGNQILFLDAVRWLVGEQSIQGVANTEEDVRIEHTKQADLGWFYATIFGIPGLVLGAGLVISRRSRGRGGRR